MKLSRTLLTLSTLTFAVGISNAAEATEELGLSFELQPIEDSTATHSSSTVAVATSDAKTVAHSEPVTAGDTPLPVPAAAINPPLAGDTTLPAGVYGGSQALALGSRSPRQSILPAPPPAPKMAPASPQLLASESSSSQTASRQLPLTPKEPIDGLLAFDLIPRPSKESTPSSNTREITAATSNPAEMIAQVFRGGVESLVARAVGSAEGTRTPEGHKTPAYFGHIDPGNGVWNLGTFSYQHAAQTPEEADARQLNRLRSQSLALKRIAQTHAIDLSLEELLNGIDLANQAPMAALEREGYVEWLAEAHKLGMTGTEAIVWARTRSFIDPDTQRWNAPGLGNNIHAISRDQSRRAEAIAKAVSAKALPLPESSTDTQPDDSTLANESLVAVQESEDIGFRLDKALNQTLGVLPTSPQATTQPQPGIDTTNRQQGIQRSTAMPSDPELPLEPDTPQSPSSAPNLAIAPARMTEHQGRTAESEPSNKTVSAAPPDPLGLTHSQAGTQASANIKPEPDTAVSEAFSTPNISLPSSSKSERDNLSTEPFSTPRVDFPEQTGERFVDNRALPDVPSLIPQTKDFSSVEQATADPIGFEP